jgi:hypothetical protein
MDHLWKFFSPCKLCLTEYKLLCSKLKKEIGQRTVLLVNCRENLISRVREHTTTRLNVLGRFQVLTDEKSPSF